MIPIEMRNRARKLRSNATAFEQDFWQAIRHKQFGNFKFRRQQVIGSYIVDFVCLSARLIVELDGAHHADSQDYDANRDQWLQQRGYRVLRVWNNEWQREPEAVLRKLWQMLNE